VAVLRIHDIASSEARPIRVAVVEDRAVLQTKLISDSRLEVSAFTSLPALLESDFQLDFELVIIGQSYSDEYAPADVERLIVRFPLARIICAFGPLCQADGRRRAIWPLSIRVPEWAFAQRLEHEVAVLRSSAAALPLTATREETVRFDTPATSSWPIRPGGSGVIYSGDVVWAESTRQLIADRTDGIWFVCTVPTELQNSASGCWIVDVDPLLPALARILTALAAEQPTSCPASPLILVTSFPSRTNRFVTSVDLSAIVVERLDLDGLAAVCGNSNLLADR